MRGKYDLSLFVRSLADMMYFEIEPDGFKTFYVLMRDSSGREQGFTYGQVRKRSLRSTSSLGCMVDIQILLGLYPQLIDGESFYTLEMMESLIEPPYRGKRLGLRLYLELLKEGWKQNNEKPLIYLPSYCIEGKTSDKAKRVWQSLSRVYPSSGECLAILQDP